LAENREEGESEVGDLAGIAGSVFFVPYYHLMPEPYSYRTPLSENALVFGAFYLFCFVPLLLLACGIAQTVGRRRGSRLTPLTLATVGAVLAFLVTAVFVALPEGDTAMVAKEHLGLLIGLLISGAVFGWGWWLGPRDGGHAGGRGNILDRASPRGER